MDVVAGGVCVCVCVCVCCVVPSLPPCPSRSCSPPCLPSSLPLPRPSSPPSRLEPGRARRRKDGERCALSHIPTGNGVHFLFPHTAGNHTISPPIPRWQRRPFVPTHPTGNSVTHAHAHTAYTHTQVAPYHTQALTLSLHLCPSLPPRRQRRPFANHLYLFASLRSAHAPLGRRSTPTSLASLTPG